MLKAYHYLHFFAQDTLTAPFEVKGSEDTRRTEEIQTSRNQPSPADPQSII